jgi:hypothetical protein
MDQRGRRREPLDGVAAVALYEAYPFVTLSLIEGVSRWGKRNSSMTLLILGSQLVNAREKNKMVAMKLKFSIMVHLMWMEGLGVHCRRTEL